jgi:hypothetical protein
MFKRNNPEKYMLISDKSSYNTKNKSKVIIKKHHSKFYKNNPYYQTFTIYDALPNSLKSETYNKKFKIVLNILIKKAYYSINEFYDVNTKITDNDVINWNTKKNSINQEFKTKNHLYIILNN